MASTFPTTLDVLSNPAGTDTMSAHADQHANANDAIEAVQARLGVTGTAVAGTVEKRLVDVIATSAAAMPSAGLDAALTAAQVVTYSTNVTGGITKIAVLTQAQYDALVSGIAVDATTEYNIVAA